MPRPVLLTVVLLASSASSRPSRRRLRQQVPNPRHRVHLHRFERRPRSALVGRGRNRLGNACQRFGHRLPRARPAIPAPACYSKGNTIRLLTYSITSTGPKTVSDVQIATLDRALPRMRFSPAGTHIAYVWPSRADLYVYDLATGQNHLIVEHANSLIADVDFTPDGLTLVYDEGRTATLPTCSSRPLASMAAVLPVCRSSAITIISVSHTMAVGSSPACSPATVATLRSCPWGEVRPRHWRPAIIPPSTAATESSFTSSETWRSTGEKFRLPCSSTTSARV